MASGAASVIDESSIIEKMYGIGENVGMAFQIKDDLLDLDLDNRSGKPAGIDIKEKKMTLPLIYLLNNSSNADKRRVINIVKNNSDDPEKVTWLIQRINDSGGVDYARAKMDEYRSKAIMSLGDFPENRAHEALIELINYTTERKK
jgi:octaprenyl-diphosphate synthase